MTDFTARDSVFYTISAYNQGAAAVPADTTQQLSTSIVAQANNYQLAVAKARIPLDTVPLTRSNIPLKQYEVSVREGDFVGRGYVRQQGGTSENFLWNAQANGTITKYLQTTSGTLTLVSTTDVSASVPLVTAFCVDDYNHLLVAGAPGAGQPASLFCVFLPDGELAYSQTFSQIQGLCIDRQQNVYIAHETSTQSVVEVYATTLTDTTFDMTLVQTISQDLSTANLTQIGCLCVDDGYLVVGYQQDKICLYNTISFTPIAGWTDADVTNFSGAAEMFSSEDRFVVGSQTDVADDLFVGVQTGGSTQIFDMEKMVEYLGPSFEFSATAKIASTRTGYAFGVGNAPQHLFAWQIDGNSEPTSAPAAVNGADTRQYETMCTDATAKSILVAGDLVGNVQHLYGFNLDNRGSNTCYDFDREFSIGDGAEKIVSFDVQKDTWKMLCTSSTGKIYQSSAPIAPKRLIVDATPSFSPPPASISRTQVGVSFNQHGSALAATLPLGTSTTAQPSATTLFRDVAAAENALQIAFLQAGFGPLGNVQQITVYAKTDLSTPLAMHALTLATTDELAQGFCLVGTAYACVSAVDSTNNQAILYVFDATTFTEEQRIVLPDLASASSSLPIAGADFGSEKFVFCANVDKLYSVKLPTASTNVVVDVPIAPTLAAPTLISSLAAQVSAGTLSLAIAYTTDVLAAAPDTLATLTLNSTYTALDSATEFATGLALRHGYYNNLLIVVPCSEMWAVMADGSVRIYSLVDSTHTSTIPASATGITSHTASIFAPQFGSENFYKWDEIAVTGDIVAKAQCLAISLESIQTVYCTHSEFKTTYVGVLTPTGIDFTVFAPVQPGFESVSIFHRPSTTTDTTLLEYSISSQALISSTLLNGGTVKSIAVNRVLGQFAAAVQNASVNLYTPAAFALVGSIPLNNAFLLAAKAGEDLSAGARSIYYIQDFVDAINSAFAVAWQRCKAAGATLQQAPVLALGSDGLCTLSYSNDYPQKGNRIGLNTALSRLIVLQSTTSALSGFQDLVLPLGSTSLKQLTRSLWKFNQLKRILFQSNTLYVAGSWLGSNEASRVVFDVDVPLSEQNSVENLGAVLYVVPNFLRVFQMTSNAPITVIQMDLLYEYADNTVQQLQIEPGASWDVKLQFCKRY